MRSRVGTRFGSRSRTPALGVALLAAWLCAGEQSAQACAACSCGDNTLTSAGVERLYKNRVRISLDERYGSLSVGEGDMHQDAWFLRSALSLSWAPLDRLTLAAMLPWSTSWLIHRDRPLDTINGLGELELSARGVLFRERRFAPHHVLSALLGLKMPTAPRVGDGTGHPYPDDDQPGSGSWDPFFGVSYAYFTGGLLSLFTSASYRLTTPGPRGYQRGSALGGGVALQIQPWWWGAFVVGISGSWAQPDLLANGVDAPNTGGGVFSASPGLLASPRTDLLIRLAVDVPMVTSLNGSQSPGTQVALSIAYDIR